MELLLDMSNPFLLLAWTGNTARLPVSSEQLYTGDLIQSEAQNPNTFHFLAQSADALTSTKNLPPATRWCTRSFIFKTAPLSNSTTSSSHRHVLMTPVIFRVGFGTVPRMKHLLRSNNNISPAFMSTRLVKHVLINIIISGGAARIPGDGATQIERRMKPACM